MLLGEIIVMFMIYSIIGWVWETPFVSVRQRKWINRGFLHGPVIPIYGFAAVTIMVSMKLIEPYLPQQKWYMVAVTVMYIATIASVWEYFTSYALESAFHTRWWDYSEHRFNLNGRIALDYSIGWGIGGYLLWRFINTYVLGLVDRVPIDYLQPILSIFYTALAIDAYTTIRELISLRAIIIKLNSISSELSGKVVYNLGHLRNEIEELKSSKSVDVFKDEVRHYFDRLEGIMDNLGTRKHELNENLLQLIEDRDMKLSEKQQYAIQHFNVLLEKSKQYSRFYRNYPKAYSRRFSGILHALKFKRQHEK